MQVVNLYKYVEANGTVITPRAKSESDEPSGYRLIADEGKILKNGETTAYCVDVETADGWEETDTPVEQTETDRVAQLEEALKILMGEVTE